MLARPFHFAMLSHPGRVRKGNEDACAASAEDGVFVVCDGMGGAAAGEVASRLAVEAFVRSLDGHGGLDGLDGDDGHGGPGGTGATAHPAEARLQHAADAANQAVFEHARRAPGLRGMGTTLVALLLDRNQAPGKPGLTLVHVGDSRCYRWRAGGLVQLTQDHSLVEEQVRMGEITAEEAQSHPMRNIITRAVGSQATVEADIVRLDARPDDVYLLASDGLTRELDDPAIAHLLREGAGAKADRLADICQALIDAANRAGGHDNITVLLLALA